MLRLSQGQLTILEACPRKFQYWVLEQLAAPHPPEQQERLEWGERFHLLMQQERMQLPMEALLQENQELGRALQLLHNTAPDLFVEESLSEHLRSFNFGNYSFSVIYDLLVSSPQQGRIIDWKTYPRPQATQWLETHWQTKLYCYSLVATSRYRPQDVSMTYWFVRGHEASDRPQSLHIPYSPQRHEQVHQELEALITQLDGWLQAHAQGKALPQADLQKGICDSCPFLGRCQGQGPSASGSRHPAFPDMPPLGLESLDLDAIEEISP